MNQLATEVDPDNRDFYYAMSRLNPKITMTSTQVTCNPNMDSSGYPMNHYKVVLKCGRRQFTTFYSMGLAHRGNPQLPDVLNCLTMETRDYEAFPDFDGWCYNFGYNIDSRKAEAVFRAVEKHAKKFPRFLGDHNWEILSEADSL